MNKGKLTVGKLYTAIKKTQWMFIGTEYSLQGRKKMILIMISDQKVLFQNINIHI